MSWDLAFKLFGVIFPTVSLVYTFVATRRKDVEARLNAGSKRMDALELRIQASEQTISGMPAKTDLHELALTITEIGGDMKAMRATLKAMSDSVNRTEGIVSRHEDYLREKT